MVEKLLNWVFQKRSLGSHIEFENIGNYGKLSHMPIWSIWDGPTSSESMVLSEYTSAITNCGHLDTFSLVPYTINKIKKSLAVTSLPLPETINLIINQYHIYILTCVV